MDKKTRANKLADFDYDLWINLLNHGSYEKIGKLIVEHLMEAPTNKYMSRRIIVCGS